MTSILVPEAPAAGDRPFSSYGPIAGNPSLADDKEKFFRDKIRPLLVDKCFECHGADNAEGGLQMNSRQQLLEGGDRGEVVVVGEPERSLLIEALRGIDDDLLMPPDSPLNNEQIRAVERWIRDGLIWP